MDGWMDGWGDGWGDGWMDGWMGGWGEPRGRTQRMIVIMMSKCRTVPIGGVGRARRPQLEAQERGLVKPRVAILRCGGRLDERSRQPRPVRGAAEPLAGIAQVCWASNDEAHDEASRRGLGERDRHRPKQRIERLRRGREVAALCKET